MGVGIKYVIEWGRRREEKAGEGGEGWRKGVDILFYLTGSPSVGRELQWLSPILQIGKTEIPRS